jgi:hypothetical protein
MEGDKRRDPILAPAGPNRAPGRYVTPRSKGAPTIAISKVLSLAGSKHTLVWGVRREIIEDM